MKNYPTQKELRELFSFVNGNLYRNTSKRLVPKKNVIIDSESYSYGRIVWILLHGEISNTKYVGYKDMNHNNTSVDNLFLFDSEAPQIIKGYNSECEVIRFHKAYIDDLSLDSQ